MTRLFFRQTVMPMTLGMFVCIGAGCGTVDPGVDSGAGSLDYDEFKANIQPVFDSRGCSNSNCHYRDKNNPNSGGPGGSLRIFNCKTDPCTEDQFRANFDSASGMTDIANPAGSKLLLKPLAVSAGGIQHLGGDIFPNTSDPDYLTILSWIQSPL
ncbi:MAG TPA: hypothetical protein VMN77_03975 [Nitrospiria bacterium]|nr:hypothetical protein [Nitrospiria bacterium]